MNKEDSNNELNNFYVEEIIKNKEVSHETGEYNEIKISNGLIKASEEESSSSEEKESASKALSLTTTVGMTVGVGGIIIGSIASLTLSLNILSWLSFNMFFMYLKQSKDITQVIKCALILSSNE